MKEQQKKQHKINQEIRQNVYKLKKYQLFNLLKYQQQIFLAQNIIQTTFLYNEYLYQQGSIPKEIFFIEQGQFHITKIIQDNSQATNRLKIKQKSIRQRKLIVNKQKKEKQPIQFQQNSKYLNSKPKKLKQHRFGTITGSVSGQVIGQEQIILNQQKREFNVKCASSNNKVIIIKRQYFDKILTLNPQIQNKLKQQALLKQKKTNSIIHNIQSTRKNLQNYVKLMNLSKQKQQKDKIIEQPLLQSVTKQFKLPRIIRKNQTDISRKKTISTINSNISQTLVIRSPERKSVENKFDYQQQQLLNNSPIPSGSQAFLLTSPQEQPLVKYKKLLMSQPRQYKQKDYDDNIELKPTKSWNNKDTLSLKQKMAKPLKSYNLLNLKPKNNGVIDSSTLIKQKQHIISLLRKDTHQMNQTKDIFQRKHLLMFKEIQKEKEKSKQSSPAHSKQYMEKMLLKALKKAGYNQALTQAINNSPKKRKTGQTSKYLASEESQQNNQTEQLETEQTKRQRNFYKVKHRKQLFVLPSDVLQNNPFDECYFSKIQ